VYTFFAPYSSSYTLSPPPAHLWYQPPTTATGRTCSTLLFSDFVGKKKEKRQKHDIFFCVWDKGSYTGSFLVIFPYIYIL
jgi:hypothetical protein